MSDASVDLLSIAGVNHQIFYSSGEDVKLEADSKPFARVFRKGGKIVYRAGTAVEWDDETGHPIT